jgi:N-methylhydantoinase A
VRVDDAGQLTSGPRSAGAIPGPACYGQGGKEATLTDANVVLGYLHPERLPSGLALDAALARAAIEEQVGAAARLDLEAAAHGVYLVGCARMAAAVRAVTIERGRDAREFVLVAFGGNGRSFAAEMARSLGIATVLVPPAPGVFSAVGLLEPRASTTSCGACSARCRPRRRMASPPRSARSRGRPRPCSAPRVTGKRWPWTGASI